MKKATNQIFRDYGLTVAVSIILAILVRSFAFEAYRIPNQTMKPGLIAGDFIFVKKWRANLAKLSFLKKPYVPERGEIVVFGTAATAGGVNLSFIRRVVGLPGDEITVKQGMIQLRKANESSAVSLDQDCDPSGKMPRCVEAIAGKNYLIALEPPLIESFGPTVVPEDQVFVVADARTQVDAKPRKSWGLIPLASIQGSASVVWLSLGGPSGAQTEGIFPVVRWQRMFKKIN